MSQEQTDDELPWCCTKTQWDWRAWWKLISYVESWNVSDGHCHPLSPGPWHEPDIEEELGNVRVHVVSALFIQPFVSLFPAGVPSSISFLKSWLVSSVWMTSGRLSFFPKAKECVFLAFTLVFLLHPYTVSSVECTLMGIRIPRSVWVLLGISDLLYPFVLIFCTGNGQHNCEYVRNGSYTESTEVRI